MRCRPALVLLENNHLLVMKYQYGDHFIYNLPGGNPDPGELLSETIARECMEELGIDVEVGQMLLMGQVSGTENRDDVLHILFEGELIGGIPELQVGETNAQEVLWMPINQLSQVTMYPNIGMELTDLLITQQKGKYVGAIQQPWLA
ncbi:MAG: NUDIX domain-containing protein [Aquirufa sp.]|jgi:8-oxo-dGTP diphosphatase